MRLVKRVLDHGVDSGIWDAEAKGSSPLYPTWI